MVGSARKCHPQQSAKVRNTSAEFPPRPPKSRVPSPTIWVRMAARARVRQRQLSLASCAFVMPCRRRAHHPCRKYLSRRNTTPHCAHGGAPTMQTDAWNCVLTYSARARARGEDVTTKHTSSQATFVIWEGTTRWNALPVGLCRGSRAGTTAARTGHRDPTRQRVGGRGGDPRRGAPRGEGLWMALRRLQPAAGTSLAVLCWLLDICAHYYRLA